MFRYVLQCYIAGKMKKKATLVERAIALVPEFAEMDREINKKLYIHGRSKSTYANYITHLAAITIHFKKTPDKLNQNEIEDYLFHMKMQPIEYSYGYFKIIVASMRLVFELYGLNSLQILLPSIKKQKRLPVVLSRSEVQQMMSACKLYSHQMMIAVLYSCGLRCGELINLRVEDIDFHRNVLYVHAGKNKRDRILPLGNLLPKMLLEFIQATRPPKWVFKGVMNRRFNTAGRQFSARALECAVKNAAIVAGIKKNVHAHILRHTFATHLLEDGIDLGTIQKFMGHFNITTTLIYTHVAQYEKKSDYNLFDHLAGTRKQYYQQLTLNI